MDFIFKSREKEGVNLYINNFEVRLDKIYTHNVICCVDKNVTPNLVAEDTIEIYNLLEDSKISEAMSFIQSTLSDRKIVYVDLDVVDYKKIENLLLKASYHNSNVILKLDKKHLVTDYIAIPFADILNNPLYVGVILNVNNTPITQGGYVDSNEICII